MSWLSGPSMEKKIKKHADEDTLNAFGGVFSIDTLPASVPHYPFFMIVNTQSHNLPGEHWKTIFIDKKKQGEVFDSLALPLSNILIRWLNRFTRRFTVNRVMYQHPLSAACGAFAVFYVLRRLKDSKCVSTTFNSSPYDNVLHVLSFYRSLK